MITDYDLEMPEINKVDRELRKFVGVETHPPFLSGEFSELFMEAETSA